MGEISDGIEIARALEVFGAQLKLADAVDAEDAQGLAQMAVADRVPMPFVTGDSVEIDRAFECLGAGRFVIEAYPLLGVAGLGQLAEQLAANLALDRLEGDSELLVAGAYLVLQGVWQHTLDLGERPFDGGRCRGQADLTGSQQP